MGQGTSDITALGAAALAAAIRERRVSCAAVMDAYLDRIDRLNPRVNAIVSLRKPDALRAEARACDEALASGAGPGPLHGLPLAVKDLEPTAAIPTTFGSPLFRDFVPDQDSIQVTRLKRAGAIIVGKTNTPEFGLGSQTYNRVFGTTLNAYEQTRTAGGSSGGAAAALALRMLPVADGSDFAGSLRNPAAYNNLFALRPSSDVIPSEKPDVFLPTPSVLGPLARSVPDLALLLSVQAGHDRRVPTSGREAPARFLAGLDRDLRGLRVAWCGDFGGRIPFEPGVLDLCERALPTFETIGCIVEAAVPDYPLERLWEDFVTLRSWHVASTYSALWRDPAKRKELKAEMVWEIERGLGHSAEQIYRASVGRTAWYQAVRRLFERYDVLLAPSAQLFPFAAAEPWPKAIAGRAMDSYHRWMEIAIVVTMSACPALNVPVGFDTRGLPMGMQMAAPVGQDFLLLQLAQAYDAATGWVERHPPPLIANETD
ncbi:MAG TPA: amidase [Hyphomicrobiales bacterium]|nr:amidase [Hyphomicrobiales bacterium]